MSKMQKKPKKGAPSWMVSFCDLMQLLLTFFIMLFSTSSTDSAKLQELLTAFAGGESVLEEKSKSEIVELNSKPLGQTSKPDIKNEEELDTETEQTSPALNEIEQIKENLEEKLGSYNSKEAQIIEENFKDKLQETGLSIKEIDEKIEISSSSEGVLVRFKDGVLFDSGQVAIKKEGINILNILGDSLNQKQSLRIEGHTDNVPTGSSIYASNWELSSARAISVMNYLTDKKFINEERCSVTGYSEYKPLAKNDTPENRALNRRVDILIVNP